MLAACFCGPIATTRGAFCYCHCAWQAARNRSRPEGTRPARDVIGFLTPVGHASAAANEPLCYILWFLVLDSWFGCPLDNPWLNILTPDS